MNYNLRLVNKGMSEKMFISKIVKGLPKEYESFTTLVKFSKEEKGLEKIKRDLINCDNENVQNKNDSIFYNKERKCFNCQKVGHIAKECRLKKANIEQIRGQPIKCFKCGEQGHISKFCRKQKPEKKFVSQSRKFSQNNQSRSQSLADCEEYFSFFQTTSNNPACEIVLDSGATSHMNKDESSFIEIDKEYTGITNANSSTSSVEGRGTIEIRTEDSKGYERKIRLSNALLVPDNSKILRREKA